MILEKLTSIFHGLFSNFTCEKSSKKDNRKETIIFLRKARETKEQYHTFSAPGPNICLRRAIIRVFLPDPGGP